MAVGASVLLKVSATESGAPSVGSSLWTAGFENVLTFGNGTTSGNIDLVYVAERTVSSGANDDVDVAGALSSGLGTSIAAAEVVGIAIVNKQKDGTANTTSLIIGGSTNGLPGYTSAVESIAPGGMYMVVSPDASGIATVTAGTGDILRITNGSGAQNKYMLAIFARSA